MATNKQPANTLRCGNISDDLAECQREGPILLNDLLPPVEGPVRRVAQRDFLRSQRP